MKASKPLSILALVALASCVLASNPLVAQQQPEKRILHITASHPDWSSAGPQELFAPYWTLEPGWNTELEMRNNVPWHELRMTPVLRMTDGTEVQLAQVTLKPEEISSVNLRDAVSAAKPELVGKMGSVGSVVFRFEGTASGNGFAAAVIRREGHPIDFHFDAEGGGAVQYEGMWWLPSETAVAYLILSNPTHAAVNAQLTFSDASGSVLKRVTLPVGARQSVRANIREALGDPALGAYGGLSLSAMNDKGGNVFATEIVYDETSGLATTLKLFDRQMIAEADKSENRNLRAPMMAFTQPDPGLGLPDGTKLEPRIFLRNGSQSAFVITPSVNWHNEQRSGRTPLASIKLQPGQTVLLNLADFQKRGQIPADVSWGTVTLNYTGRSGDLVAVAMSYDNTNHYGLQTPFSEITSQLFKGSMWHADPLHNALITMGNGGTDPTEAQMTLFYDQGKGGEGTYRAKQTLAPGEQMWLNVGEVISKQIPDADGKTIPPEVMFGSYELRDLRHPALGFLYEGKLIVDKTYGHASYGCAHCCGYSQSRMSPTPFNGPPNTDNTDTYQSYSVCDSSWEDFDVFFSPSSSNTSVATMSVSTMHTVAPGGAQTSGKNELLFQGNLQSPCVRTNMPGTQGVTVQVPDHLVVLSDSQQTLDCGSDPSTRLRTVTYEVDDVDDRRLQFPFSMRENVPTNIVSSCNGSTVQTGANCVLNTTVEPHLSGEFSDFLSPGCPNSPTNTPCGFVFTNQQWQWCPSSGSPTSMGTIGKDTVDNTIIEMDGNITGFVAGTVFQK
jgi:hypothetical protein